MQTRCSSRAFTMMAAAILAFVATFTLGTSDATAACPVVTITNNTPCAVRLYILCPSPAPAMGPYNVAANSVLNVPLPATCDPFRVVAIVCGNRTLVPAGGCLNNVSVAPGCCADVCFDPAACTITFNPTPGPCPC